jgi:hypothetical protein
MDSAKLLELFVALSAGGVLTMLIRAIMERSKNNAEARKITADGEGKIVEVALRMANKLENSLTALELKTDDLAKKNLKLEQELGEIRLSNINLLREVEALKRQNGDLESICGVLVRENTHLKVELDNCIKKEI